MNQNYDFHYCAQGVRTWLEVPGPAPEDPEQGTICLTAVARLAYQAQTTKDLVDFGHLLARVGQKLKIYYEQQSKGTLTNKGAQIWVNNHPISAYMGQRLKILTNETPDRSYGQLECTVKKIGGL